MLTIRLQYIDIKLGYAYHNKCSSHLELENSLSGCAVHCVQYRSECIAASSRFIKRNKIMRDAGFDRRSVQRVTSHNAQTAALVIMRQQRWTSFILDCLNFCTYPLYPKRDSFLDIYHFLPWV